MLIPVEILKQLRFWEKNEMQFGPLFVCLSMFECMYVSSEYFLGIRSHQWFVYKLPSPPPDCMLDDAVGCNCIVCLYFCVKIAVLV